MKGWYAISFVNAPVTMLLYKTCPHLLALYCRIVLIGASCTNTPPMRWSTGSQKITRAHTPHDRPRAVSGIYWFSGKMARKLRYRLIAENMDAGVGEIYAFLTKWTSEDSSAGNYPTVALCFGIFLQSSRISSPQWPPSKNFAPQSYPTAFFCAWKLIPIPATMSSAPIQRFCDSHFPMCEHVIGNLRCGWLILKAEGHRAPPLLPTKCFCTSGYLRLTSRRCFW